MEHNEPQGHVEPPSIAWKPHRSKGRTGGRTRADKPTGTSGKRPLKISIDVAVYQRIATHATMSGKDISTIITELAVRHLNDWVVHAKPGSRAADQESA